jgi:hypothetical protein
MLQIIEHRRNSIESLATTRQEFGVEIDIRSDVAVPGKLHLSHDPWTLGEDFDAWLAHFVALGIQGPLVLNTKEDNLEDQIEARLKQCGVSHYFFLDTAPATLVRRCRAGLGAHMAARLSQYEPAESLSAYLDLPPAYRPAWLWVDCFDGCPIDEEKLSGLESRLNICLVSPELQGHGADKIASFRKLASCATAVCTKFPYAWGSADVGG